nr:hypothetical protein [Tanacetum cinerariifolium]
MCSRVSQVALTQFVDGFIVVVENHLRDGGHILVASRLDINLLKQFAATKLSHAGCIAKQMGRIRFEEPFSQRKFAL